MAEPNIGILSPGEMGGATGAVLRQGGFPVFTCLIGRSELTAQIAAQAGIIDLPDLETLVSKSDILLSILPPGSARQTAEDVTSVLKATAAPLVYVDCNAVAPQTVREMDRMLTSAGAAFIDAGIIGGPPRPASSPRFYCSGPDTAPLQSLKKAGLDVRLVGAQIGQASGLKMVYAASTKGTTALWTELLLAARALGLEEALLGEFGDGNEVAHRNLASIPSMPRRARRWVAEMEEIAATFEALGLTPRILEGAADMYRFVGETQLARQTSRQADPSRETVLSVLLDELSR